MHPAVLATSGYALLLSSVVSLVILLKKNVKRCLGSSIHMLAMSDILSSALTAVLLIINQYNQSFDGPFTYYRINDTTSESWMKFVNMDERAFVGSFASANASEDGIIVNSKESNSCSYKDVIMHYSMFLFPFVNAFVSLLSFSVLSSVDVDNVSTKCAKMIDSERSCVENPIKNDVKSNLTRNKNEITVTGLGIIGQWLLPVLLTAVLQFAEHENPKNMQRSDDMGCVYGTNFPFENCLTIDDKTMMEVFNKTEYITASAGDYLEGLDSSRISQTNYTEENGKELADVVSKIYQIVGALRNFTTGEIVTTDLPTFYEPSRLMNITTFMEMRSSTEKYHERTTDSGKKNKDEILTSSLAPKPEVNEDEEMELFESLMKNSSDVYENTNFTEIVKELGETDPEVPEVIDVTKIPNKIVHAPDDEIRSDEKLLADMVQRIKAVTMQLHTRDKHQPGRNTERARSQKLKNHSKYSPLEENYFEGMEMCVKKQCFVSTRFLKIHLLVLVFLVYFVPIFVSAILYTRVNYACRNIKEKMEMKANAEAAAVGASGESVDEKIEGVSGPSGWFAADMSDENKISGGSLEDLVCSGDTKESSDTRKRTIAPGTDNLNALQTIDREMQGMQKLSKLFATSLLFAVLLWTPTFLEVLAKVFLCVRCVDWLMNVSFVGALLFGVLRNILDLRMITAREMFQNNNEKENRVCPS